MIVFQSLKNLRQRIAAHHCRRAANAQTAFLSAGERGHLLQRGIVLAQDGLRAIEQLLAGFSQDHFARRADEKPRARFAFQLTNLHADRRLGDVHAFAPRR